MTRKTATSAMPASAPTGRHLAHSLTGLHMAGCTQTHRKKMAGARADRRDLLRLLRALGPGDAVTVTRIDRQARSTFDLFAIIKQNYRYGKQFRFTGGTVSRHRHWVDDCRSWRARGSGART